MTLNARTVTHGTVGGTAINVDMTHIETGKTVKVTLSANYAMARLPGGLFRPHFTGAAAASLEYPRTVANGTTLTLTKGEADALVAAGAASYG